VMDRSAAISALTAPLPPPNAKFDSKWRTHREFISVHRRRSLSAGRREKGCGRPTCSSGGECTRGAAAPTREFARGGDANAAIVITRSASSSEQYASIEAEAR
jgi:hypothetical protein